MSDHAAGSPGPSRPLGRRARLRRLRAGLGPRPRGDRARQDRGQREGHEAGQGLGGRHRGRRLRLPRPDHADARLRLGAQRRSSSSDAVWAGFLIEAVLFFAVAGGRRLPRLQSPSDGRAARRRRWRSKRASGSSRRLNRAPPPRPGNPEAPPDGRRARDLQRRRRAGRPAKRRRPGEAAPSRSATDIERQREELSHSVELLRGRVTELTDWRRQVREHRREIADRRRGRRLRRSAG